MTLPDFLTQTPRGSIRLTGHRIGLVHIVALYKQGYTPEMLLDQFPTLSLPLIHKVIAFYLENQAEVDALCAEYDRKVEELEAAPRRGPDYAELRRRMEAKRAGEDA